MVFRPGIFSEYHGINQIGDRPARALSPLQTSNCPKRWALSRLRRTTADAKRDTSALSGSFSALCYSPQAAVIPLIYAPCVFPNPYLIWKKPLTKVCQRSEDGVPSCRDHERGNKLVELLSGRLVFLAPHLPHCLFLFQSGWQVLLRKRQDFIAWFHASPYFHSLSHYTKRSATRNRRICLDLFRNN